MTVTLFKNLDIHMYVARFCFELCSSKTMETFKGKHLIAVGESP